MKAISLLSDTRQVELTEMPVPVITQPNQLKLRILEIGICGTDREQVVYGYGEVPEGTDKLVIGHEMLGQVVEAGAEVKGFSVGDYAVLTVRRGCGQCTPCLSNRSDLCYTGLFTERGIKGRHGFETEYVVDEEQYAVKVPHCALSVYSPSPSQLLKKPSRKRWPCRRHGCHRWRRPPG